MKTAGYFRKKNVDMKQVKNLDQTITKFNEAIASIMKDHKTKVQNSWKRWSLRGGNCKRCHKM